MDIQAVVNTFPVDEQTEKNEESTIQKQFIAVWMVIWFLLFVKELTIKYLCSMI